MTELRIVPEEEPESVPRAASPALEYYASELKRHREAAGLTQAQLAGLISYSKSMVSMVETAKRSPLDTREGGRIASKFTECCDEALNTGGALARILPLLDGSNDPYPPWFRPYAHLESEATAIYQYQTQIIPGILQTEEYARAVLACGTPALATIELEKKVAARIRRQTIFEREQPPCMWVAVDEVVVRRPLGGRGTLRRQLEHLAEVGTRPYVTLVIVPSEAETHAALDGSFSILTFTEDQPVLYVEGRHTASITNLRHDVTPALQSFMTLCAQGLSPQASLGLLTGIMREL